MMRKLILLAALLMPALGSSEPLRVFVSVPPLKTFVKSIGGDHVEVRAMVRPGHNPATYDPTPQQIGALAKTALYIRTGVPFERAWMKRIRSANPDLRVVDAREGIDLRILEGHEDTHSEKKGHVVDTEHDPHVWTSPVQAKYMALNIRNALADMDPENRQDYMRNAESFIAELDRLNGDIKALLHDLPDRKFMVFHPSWGYFADTYELIQVPIENEGKTPGARTLTTLIEQAKREKVKVIFVQPQFDKRTATRLASAIGGQVVAIDPLASDYAENLREVARRIAAAVQR